MIPQRFRRFSPFFAGIVLFLLVFSPAARDLTLTVIRFPFSIIRWTFRVALLAPQLPRLTRQQRALQERLAQRELEIADLREALRRANQAEQLAKAAPGYRGILAPVLGRSLMPTQHTLLLGKGRNSGIIADSVVLTGDGMIGRVVETHANTSLVMLLTDPESRVAGLIERSRETGMVAGRARGSLELMYLDADADIQQGDVVVTAGLGRAYPKGLMLGTITRVDRSVSSGDATAQIRPAGKLGFLEDVLCLPPSQEAPAS